MTVDRKATIGASLQPIPIRILAVPCNKLRGSQPVAKNADLHSVLGTHASDSGDLQQSRFRCRQGESHNGAGANFAFNR